MKKSVKYILAAIVALAVVAGVSVHALAPLAVATLTLFPRNAEAYFIEQGFVRGDIAVDVFALVGGRILSVHVEEGQRVQAGDILAVVDSTEFAHEIEQIRLNNAALLAQIDNLGAQERQARDGKLATLASLRGEYEAILAQQATAQTAEIDQSRARTENIQLQNILVSQSRSDVESAEAELANIAQLYQAGAIPRSQLEAAERALAHAQTALGASQQTLEIISADTAVSQNDYFAGIRSSLQAQISGLERQISASYIGPMVEFYNTQIQGGYLAIANLQRHIANSTITSPVSGVVTDLHIDGINVLNTAQPVATITNPRNNMIEVYVSTLDIDDIRLGDEVDLIRRRQRGDIIYPGRVYSIGEQAEVRVSSLGVEERRVLVVLHAFTMPERLSELRPGSDVDVRFITYFAEDQLLVPRSAVFSRPDAPPIADNVPPPPRMVFVVENGLAVERPVVISRETRAEFVVAQGLRPGDVVIRDANMEGLRNGARVASE
ncbi:MAG: HlyD family secretion protein [Defluviitaleaceae bacterium]|nr:HlyD family secretion protein [Defluviitaleaceae bacterium]